jgi:ribosomal protein S27AE
MASVARPAPSERAVDLRSELAAWRRAHPGATLLAIEQEVDRRLAGVRADLVTETVGVAEAAAGRPACPRCGAAMERAGTRPRRVTGPHNETLVLEGARYRCPACGAGLSPPR